MCLLAQPLGISVGSAFIFLICKGSNLKIMAARIHTTHLYPPPLPTSLPGTWFAFYFLSPHFSSLGMLYAFFSSSHFSHWLASLFLVHLINKLIHSVMKSRLLWLECVPKVGGLDFSRLEGWTSQAGLLCPWFLPRPWSSCSFLRSHRTPECYYLGLVELGTNRGSVSLVPLSPGGGGFSHPRILWGTLSSWVKGDG